MSAVTSLIASVCVCTPTRAATAGKSQIIVQLLGDQVSCWLHCSARKLIDYAIIFHLLMALVAHNTLGSSSLVLKMWPFYSRIKEMGANLITCWPTKRHSICH